MVPRRIITVTMLNIVDLLSLSTYTLYFSDFEKFFFFFCLFFLRECSNQFKSVPSIRNKLHIQMVFWRIITVIISSILRKIPLNRLALVPTLTTNIFFPPAHQGDTDFDWHLMLHKIWDTSRDETCSQNVCLRPKFVNLYMILLPILFFQKWDFLTSEQVQCWS